MNKGLGRLPEFDGRSRNFPVRSLIRSASKPRSYTWSCPAYLDQGQEGACTGFAFTHEALARPVKVQGLDHNDAFAVYRRARELDQWPGEDYDGTSIIAAVKAAMERGWYAGYRWGFSIEDVILAIGYKGPVVLGVNWYEGMGEIGSDGFVQAAGTLMGGHAILANGVSIGKRAVRLHNSWGTDWGNNGEAFLSFKDLERLLKEDGEACVPLGRQISTKTQTMKGQGNEETKS